MSTRAYKRTIGALVCALVILAWRSWVLFGQVVTASLIDHECRITQESFTYFPLSSTRDPVHLARDLEFLVGYYEGCSNQLAGSRLERIVRRDYEQTLTNALAILRRETTNDLGSDPHAWIERYGK